jgi:hypothetical protein
MRDWDKKEASKMVFKLLSPDSLLEVMEGELHLFHHLRQVASGAPLDSSTSADDVIACLSGLSSFLRGVLGPRLGKDFETNLCTLVTAIKTYNKDCEVFPGRALGIVTEVAIPALRILYAEPFNRRLRASFAQNSTMPFPAEIAP